MPHREDTNRHYMWSYSCRFHSNPPYVNYKLLDSCKYFVVQIETVSLISLYGSTCASIFYAISFIGHLWNTYYTTLISCSHVFQLLLVSSFPLLVVLSVYLK